jgi:hypothetical protein
VVGVPSSSKIASSTEGKGNNAREPVFNETLQLGIVVRDLEATLRRYQDDYGIGPWEFAQIDLGEANNYREYGEPVERSTRIAIATVGRVMWELIEPLDEEGIYMPVSLLRKVRVFTQVRVRNCPKRGLSNAPSMNLAAIRSTKWAKRNLSAPFGATLRTHLRLFGRFLISTLAIYQRKG